MGRFVIRLNGLRFYSRIGVFDQERSVGNEFRVDLTAVADASGFRSENLDTTVSYADIYDVVAEAMRREWLLLESVSSYCRHCARQMDIDFGCKSVYHETFASDPWHSGSLQCRI